MFNGNRRAFKIRSGESRKPIKTDFIFIGSRSSRKSFFKGIT